WKQANTVGAYLVLKVFSGYRTCVSQPDSWHQYSPAVATDSQKGYSYAIAPGFWQKGLSVRLARDLTRWNQNVRDMVASGAPFQLVTTFNEWGEGTSVEGATEWASSSGYGAYLDALHNNGGQTTLPTSTVVLPTNIATSTALPLPTSSFPSTAKVFAPAADATVRQEIPSTNYGKSVQLRTDGSPLIRSYLRFDVQGMGGAVTKATLRVFANSSSSAGYKVHKVSDLTWNENTITYNNAPPLGSVVGSMGAFAGGAWTSVDVTSLVTGNGTISLALAGINSTAVSLVSREGGANAPQLVVNTAGAGSPGGATPLPTQTALPTSTPTIVVPITATLGQIASPTTAPTQAFTATAAPTQPAIPTNTPSLGLSATPLPTQAFTATAAPTQIGSATSAPTNLPSATSAPTQTANPTITPTAIPSATPTLTKTSTPVPTLTSTRTPTPIATSSGSSVVFVGAGDISSCGQNNDEATAKLLDSIPGTIFTAGDNAYDSGTFAQYTDCYDPTWGRNKARTKPVPGNHEYNTSGAAGYFQYFNTVPAYYAYNLGAWRIYALNSEIDGSATSAQVKWLQADLAANPSLCTLAYWHKPRWSSGAEHGSDSARQTLWQVLYNAGVELVINGHEHNYERFAEMNASGAAVSPGLREIVAGTGGQSHYGFATPLAASQVRNSSTFGVLKLTLRSNGYDWQFVPVAGATFTDSGSTNCH
ncbi:MAG TPA: DNRLRE domain-containing protein, partial [Anaerolineales bacterium]|nr:DNRLRE domain-containing protein [Anaerolineales bacterium]